MSGTAILPDPAVGTVYAANISAEDLGAVIAYLKGVPRLGLDAPEPELTVMGQIMLVVGMFGQIFPAEYIDHDQPFPAMPAISANPEYGEYLSRFCRRAWRSSPVVNSSRKTTSGSLSKVRAIKRRYF